MSKMKYYLQKAIRIRFTKLLSCAVTAAKAQNNFLYFGIFKNMLKLFLKYAVTPDEYILYMLWNKTGEQLKSMYFHVNNVNLIEILNDPLKLYILRDKKILLERLKSALGRDYIDLEICSDAEFIDFSKRHAKWIAKPRTLTSGSGIFVYDANDSNVDRIKIRNDLLQQNVTLVEEFITQHEEMNRMYANSVNTIRIYTLKIDDQVDIVLDMLVRFGSAGGKIDFDGEITVKINVATGTLFDYGFDKYQKKYYRHPDSQVLFKDFQIPYFQQIKELAVQTAFLVPEINYIGWDIAVSDKGPVIVEGNGAPASFINSQHYALEETGYGIKDEFDDLLDYYKKRMIINDRKIKTINNILYANFEVPINQLDVIIVLGSRLCRYRAERAFQIGKNRADIIYIVSGAGICSENTNNRSAGDLNEAEFMRDYLMEKGIPEDKIWLEEQSFFTKENIENSIQLLKQNKHLFHNSEKVYVGVVTAAFHMKRTFGIVQQLEDERNFFEFISIPAYGVNTNLDNWFSNPVGVKSISEELVKLGYDFSGL